MAVGRAGMSFLPPGRIRPGRCPLCICTKGEESHMSYLVGQLARQRDREVRAEQQQQLRAAALAKASQQASRPEQRMRWAVRKVFRLRSASD